MNDQAAFRPEQVVERVRSRLIAAGAATELGILERLGGYELDTLIRRECGWGSTAQWTTSGPAVEPSPSTGNPQIAGPLSPTNTQGCAPSGPQARGAMVAA